MRDLFIPDSPSEHLEWILDLLGPVAVSPHWRAVATVMVAERAPLGYVATHDGEATNLSMWFGLLDVRAGTYAEDRQLVRSLYVAHELAHLLTATPHAATRVEFADAFHDSERFASYETEFAVYGDLPHLAGEAPFTPLLASWLADRGVDLHDAATLMEWRDAVIADPELLSELPSEASRLASYAGTRDWASEFWDRLDRLGWWRDPVPGPVTSVFDPATVRAELAATDVQLDQAAWEQQVVLNVVRAHRLCGLAAPELGSLDDARTAAAQLDGFPLATVDTRCLEEIHV